MHAHSITTERGTGPFQHELEVVDVKHALRQAQPLQHPRQVLDLLQLYQRHASVH